MHHTSYTGNLTFGECNIGRFRKCQYAQKCSMFACATSLGFESTAHSLPFSSKLASARLCCQCSYIRWLWLTWCFLKLVQHLEKLPFLTVVEYFKICRAWFVSLRIWAKLTLFIVFAELIDHYIRLFPLE